METRLLDYLCDILRIRKKEQIIPLYKTIVIPHLELCIQTWRPYRKKDTDVPETVQRRTTKMIPHWNDSYSNKSLLLSARKIKHQIIFTNSLYFHSLNYSARPGDLKETFDIINDGKVIYPVSVSSE